MEAHSDGASVAVAFRDDHYLRLSARPGRPNPSDARQVYGVLGYSKEQKVIYLNACFITSRSSCCFFVRLPSLKSFASSPQPPHISWPSGLGAPHCLQIIPYGCHVNSLFLLFSSIIL